MHHTVWQYSTNSLVYRRGILETQLHTLVDWEPIRWILGVVSTNEVDGPSEQIFADQLS